MKHCCRNCHFLARHDIRENGFTWTATWTKEEREEGQMKVVPGLSRAAKCRQGIWDTGVDPELNSKLEEIIDENRKHECFFIEHSEGMLFQTALELHDKREENRRYRRNIFIAVVSLCISIIVLIVSIIGFDDVEKFLTQFLGG